MTLPASPFCKGMSAINKPNWDNQVEAEGYGLLKKASVCGRIELQQWDTLKATSHGVMILSTTAYLSQKYLCTRSRVLLSKELEILLEVHCEITKSELT